MLLLSWYRQLLLRIDETAIIYSLFVRKQSVKYPEQYVDDCSRVYTKIFDIPEKK